MNKTNNLRVTKSPKEEIHNFIKQIKQNNKDMKEDKLSIDYNKYKLLLQDYNKIYQNNKHHSSDNKNYKIIGCLIKAANGDYHDIPNDTYWNNVATGTFDGMLGGATISFMFLAIVLGSPIARCIHSAGLCIMGFSMITGGTIGAISAGYSSKNEAELKAFADASSICIPETDKYEMAGELVNIHSIE